MKQYIKKALWIIPFVFSLNLSATTYYFVGAGTSASSKAAATLANWNSVSTATSSNNASTRPGTAEFNAQAASGHIFDFNGKSVIFNANMTLGEVTFVNNKNSTTSNITIGSGVVITINRASPPSFLTSTTISGGSGAATYDFSTISTFLYSGEIDQIVAPLTYYNLRFEYSPALSVAVKRDINGSVSVTNDLQFYNTKEVQLNINSGGSLTLNNCDFTYNTSLSSKDKNVLKVNSGGSITDSRTSKPKNFPCTFFQYAQNQGIGSGTYYDLAIYASGCYLGANVTIENYLIVGSSGSYINFDFNGKVAELGNISLSKDAVNDDYSKLNLSNSNSGIVINRTISNPLELNDLMFGSTITNVKTNSNVSNLTLKGSSVIKLTSNLEISNSLTLTAGTLDLNSNILYFSGSSITNSTGKIDATASGSHITFNRSTAGSVISMPKCLSNTIDKLTLNFSNGGQVTLSEDLTVTSTLTNSTASNFIGLNDYLLEISNSYTNTNGSSGGYIIGSSASSIICNATCTLYFDQTDNENRTLKNLTVDNSNTVTIGNWLYIADGADYGVILVGSSSTLNTNDKLILKANADGYAQIDNSPGTISGKLHVQTYFDGTYGRRYRFIAPQVTNGNIFSLRDSGSLVSAPTGIKELVNNWGIQITGGSATSTTDTGFDISTTKNPSAFEFIESNAGSTGLGTGNDAGWKPLHSGKQNLTNGKGYRILIRGDRTVQLTGTTGKAADTISTTTQISGNYVGTSKTITLSNSGTSAGNNGVNFIGNPYPATIDWDLVYSNNSTIGVDATYVIYDNRGGSYASYSAASNTGTCSNFISSGQGFLVYTTTNNADLVIDESCKDVTGLGDRFFKKIRTNHLVIKMEKDAQNFDRSILYFLPGSTATYDKYDAGHIKNSSVNLASIDAQNNYYSINCMDSLGESKIVPLTFDGTALGTYTINFEDCGTFQNHDIYLVDDFTKSTTKMDDITKYTFTISSDPISSKNGRLSVQFAPKEANSTNKLIKGQGIIVSPNPINDKINLNLKDGVDYRFEIKNLDGKIIKSGKLDKNSKTIGAQNISSGIYFITLNSNTETQTIKFVK